MKKLLAIAAILMTSVILFDGCKKGPEDPFISFKSREKRMIGKWKVVEFKINGEDTLETTWSDPDVQAVPPSCGTKKVSYNYTNDTRFNFDKNGRYDVTTKIKTIQTITYTSPGTSCQNTTNTLLDTKAVSKGLWNFVGGVGSIKNKEQLVLTESEDGVLGNVYNIIRLSSKQVKLYQAVTDATGNAIKYEWTLEPDKGE
jgi:hypothetical protein